MADRTDVYEAAEHVGERPVCSCCMLPLYERELQYGRRVCVRCEETLAGRLREILALWGQLSGRLEKGANPGGGDGGRSPSGGGSAAPGNLNALSLLAGDVTGRLLVHEDDWRRVLGWPIATFRGDQDQTLRGVLEFLVGNLHWACHATAVDVYGLHQDTSRLVGEMTAVVTGEGDPRVKVGHPCPFPALGWAVDDPNAPACGGMLRMDPRVPEIRCSTCRVQVPRHRWLELGITLGTITLDTGQEAAA